jgi:NTE family protein
MKSVRWIARRWAPCLRALMLAAAVLAAWPAMSAPERPRIGLALSGGGARGFSHVGVLRALEAMRIPVDCIAGTSAGSAVGAAYAMGLAPDEIEARLRAADWDGRMFADQPPRPELPYRQKNRVGGDPIGVTLGVGGDGVKGSAGILAGQQVELFLHGLLGNSTELASFDTLPIPYRAIATDLVTGGMVVQGKGSLVHAVRASMAVPSAFAPVKVEGRLLVDGGLTQNLPVAAVRESCADVVIAVNIGSPLLGADELGSTFGVALQMVSILMERNVSDSLASLRPGDVLITPDLGTISAIDFGRGVDGIPAGEAATLAARARLQHLALPPAAYAAWQAERATGVPGTPVVARVEVAPTRFVDPSYFALQGIEQGRAPGPVDTEALHRRIQRWSGSGDFTSIAYSVRPSQDGYTLWIDAQEKPAGPDYLQLGFAGAADSHGYTDFAVQAALRRTWLNEWGAEWVTLARFGRERQLQTSWLQPLGAGSPWFVEPLAGVYLNPLRLFVDDRAVGEFDITRAKVELGAGVQGPLGLARLALVGARIDTRPAVGLVGVPGVEADINGVTGRLVYDQLDDLDFPRRGAAARADVFVASRRLGASTSYRREELDFTGVHSLGEATWRARGRWARVSGSDSDVKDAVSVGGFLDLSGYQEGQFSGTQVAYLSVGAFRRLLALPQPFGSGLYAGATIEAARIHDPLGLGAASIDRVGGALYVGAATAFGPAYLGLGIGQNGQRALYLFLGRP